MVVTINLAILPVRMVKPDIAIACFVENLNKAIVIGMISPPPPMPPTLASASRIGSTMIPTNSLKYIGKMVLCSQIELTQML